MKAHIMIGISGSGKSTYVKEHATPNSVVVNNDSVRRRFVGINPEDNLWDYYKFDKNVESQVKSEIDALINHALYNDKDLWIDNTNLTAIKNENLKKFLEQLGYEVYFHNLNTSSNINTYLYNNQQRINRLKPSDIKFKLTELMPYYSKPKLSFPQSTIVTIPINLNLEPDEIISYVLKAKEEYSQKNLKIKHPLELIGNEFKLSKKLDSEKELPKEKGKRKKAIADAFYVYDLFKILTYYFKEKTQEIKNKRNNEITEIRKSLRYLKKEKKDRIEECKNMYKDNINLYSKSQLKNIISDITNLSVHKVERYFKYMKECIENKKYKELMNFLVEN